ncbi:NADPH-dependent FMN reductase [Balneola sp. MJW-20]|uniref:NADPH-dependent FMN reductase n=1 Tax=Gracilimonas aurantiaca TaxID=3234185 RepID=UPI0034661D81
MKIKVISSTDRPGSMARKVSDHVAELYQKEGADAEVICLRDFPLLDVVGGKYGKEIPSVEAFNAKVLEADGLVFVIPEYNGSFPGILKVFIDYLPFPEAFEKMPMAFIGEAAGAFGALRSVEQFQMIANYRNALQFPERVFIQRVHKNFSEEEGLTDEFARSLLDSQVENFIKFIDSVKDKDLSQLSN